MSSSLSLSLPVKVACKKTVCKVCLDAGKEEREYSSHFTKNEKGKVICPTLLNLLCKFCTKKGHTISYCPVLIKNKKRESFNNSNCKSKKDILIKKIKVSFNNRFQILDESSSSSDKDEQEDADDEFEKKDEEVFIPASPLNSPNQSFQKPTYASIILSPTKEKVNEKVKVVIPSLGLKKKILWSEYTSSDDEDYY